MPKRATDYSAELRMALIHTSDVSPRLTSAFLLWIDSVEERFASDRVSAINLDEVATRLAAVEERLSRDTDPSDMQHTVAEMIGRLAAVEKSIANLYEALSSKPSPATVQRAVADIETPEPTGKKK